MIDFNKDITGLNKEELLSKIEEEIKTVNAIDKKNWIMMYELMKMIKIEELWTVHLKATSFSSWVRYFSMESKIHQTVLWNRYRAGEVYSNYCKHKTLKGEKALKLDKLNISPDALVLLEKINKHAPDMATKITEDVMRGKVKRKELVVMYEVLRPEKPNYEKCLKINHKQLTEEERNSTITAAQVLATLTRMHWVGKKDNNGFKGNFEQEDQVRKVQKDKAHAIPEFPVFTGTSQKSRKIDMLGIENINKEYYEKHELNLHGIEIKVNKYDLINDKKFPEYGEFVDYLWLAIPEELLELAKECKFPEHGIIVVNKFGDARVEEKAKYLEPTLRHKTLETAVARLM